MLADLRAFHAELHEKCKDSKDNHIAACKSAHMSFKSHYAHFKRLQATKTTKETEHSTLRAKIRALQTEVLDVQVRLTVFVRLCSDGPIDECSFRTRWLTWTTN